MPIPQPLVSIIIPAYQAGHFLPKALESVLSQDYPHTETIVIENGSNDGTQKLVASMPNMRYERLEEAHVAKARNRGVELARGQLIAFLDADDHWPVEKISKQVAFLQQESTFDGVIGKQHIYLEAGCNKPHWLKREFLNQPQPAYLPSALMIKKECFAKFATHYKITDDVAWFFKAKHTGLKIKMLDDIVVFRRIHKSNHSGKCEALHKELLQTIRESLNERRASAS